MSLFLNNVDSAHNVQHSERIPAMLSTCHGGCTQGMLILILDGIGLIVQDRFNREIASVQIPKRRGAEPGQVNSEYQSKIVALHGAILGATALYV